MITFSSHAADRAGVAAVTERWTTQAAVADDVRRIAPARLADLPASVPVLLAALANHDGATYVHSLRVAHAAFVLAHAHECAPLLCHRVFVAGLLHDVGKMYLPTVLIQPHAVLGHTERDLLHTHAARGARLLEQHRDVAALAPIIAAQHERFDGGAVFHGSDDTSVATATSMVVIADTLDTMADPHATPPHADDVCDMLHAGAGWRWDPAIAATAIRLVAQHAPRAARPAHAAAAVDFGLLAA